MPLDPRKQITRILHVRPSDPARTAIAEYARHFAKALQRIPGAEVTDFLPPALSENLDCRHAREAIRDFVAGAALPFRNAAGRILVHVEEGNALHREFWAGYYLQEVLPKARFLCTIHDPPQLCSNPYRYVSTEFEGRTPVRLLNVGLTKAAETFIQWRRQRVESRFIRRCEAVFALSEMGTQTLRRHPLFQTARVYCLPHVFDLESLRIGDCGLRIADSPISDFGLRIAELGPQHSVLGPQSSALSSQSSALSTQHSLLTVLFCFLNTDKGIETLLDAFEILLDRLEREAAPTRQRLLIFGGVAPGERAAVYLARLGERIVRSRHASRIELRPGFVPDEERDRLLAAADILVLPFPTAPAPFSSAGAIRALALGKAVVAARANTVSEVIRDGETGLLFPETDATALAEKLHALTLDPALRARLGAGARRLIEERHVPDRVAQSLAGAYRQSSPVQASTQTG